mgnify:CR=1 FL=1
MAGRPRKPISVQESTRRVHRSTAEREDRRLAEEFGGDDAIECPDRIKGRESRKLYLDTARALKDMGIWKSIDSDQLACYVTSEMLYRLTTAKYASAISSGDEEEASAYERRQDKAFRQRQSAANALGLNVTSRCRIVRPDSEPTITLEL